MEPISKVENIISENTIEDNNGVKKTYIEFPSIYNFPPFFTKQPNEQIWISQAGLWDKLILSYCEFKKLWKLELPSCLELEVFKNDKIKRRLKYSDAKDIFNYMVNSGNGEWLETVSSADSADYCCMLVYWKRPEEWANVIMAWINKTGQNGSILTLDEVREGDLVVSEEFYEIDEIILKKALSILIKQKKAKLLKVDGIDAGIKFF